MVCVLSAALFFKGTVHPKIKNKNQPCIKDLNNIFSNQFLDLMASEDLDHTL